METNLTAFKRIVTGHDADGKAIIVSNEVPSRTYMVGGPNGAKFHEIWNTQQTPAFIDSETNPEENALTLGPPKQGTRIRVIDFPPESDEIRNLTKEQAFEHFKTMKGEHASKADEDAPHPLMHKTETIDYGIVLEGELTLIVDRGETIAKAGDIIIQRGTNHAWSNKSGKICRVVFILIDGKFDEKLL
ncbi:cupin domain-containing protein [Flavobacterium sp. LHD-80]|uniref:cupin domain-containing protein n=1 Tax=Flavobacterium sp. LHD-80 TaxID=3071411 RepID=UPI0027E1E22F|nr:cupin domain-containing protein [Flavobacterium sp. LHD-80]MDQ6470814.1 cupin domain-containing protein [Flavobacterium sp. LHD-80]